jgi:hypothetical protein
MMTGERVAAIAARPRLMPPEAVASSRQWARKPPQSRRRSRHMSDHGVLGMRKESINRAVPERYNPSRLSGYRSRDLTQYVVLIGPLVREYDRVQIPPLADRIFSNDRRKSL